ncbi:MAG: IS3 family transposase [Acidimicrobiales bacterium]
MCRAIGLSERTYWAARCRPPSARAVADEQLKAQISTVFDANYRCYGARRVWLALCRQGGCGGPLHGGAAHDPDGSARHAARPQAVHDRRRHRSVPPGGPGGATFRGDPAERALARRYNVRVDLGGLAVCM